jgi:hypothetical protein
MNNWQKRIRAAGYTGELDLRSLLKLLENEYLGFANDFSLTCAWDGNPAEGYPPKWSAYVYPHHEVAHSPEEAVTSLWIKLKQVTA